MRWRWRRRSRAAATRATRCAIAAGRRAAGSVRSDARGETKQKKKKVAAVKRRRSRLLLPRRPSSRTLCRLSAAAALAAGIEG